jgi:hypothetical protein
MAGEPDGQNAGGQKTPEGGTQPAGGGESKNGDPGASSGDSNDPRKQYVTPEILQGVLAQNQKTFLRELGKFTDPLKTELETQRAALEELRAGRADSGGKPPSGDKKSGQVEPSELTELRRQIKDLETRSAKAENDAQTASQRERDYRFRSMVMDALTRHKCLKPERVFRMIAPDLIFSEDGGKITREQENEFGQMEEFDLDIYIKRFLKEDLENGIPEMFEGKMRPGSPAGGDERIGAGKYRFTLDQIKNEEFYEKHKDEIREAFEQGQVQGWVPPAAKK